MIRYECRMYFMNILFWLHLTYNVLTNIPRRLWPLIINSRHVVSMVTSILQIWDIQCYIRKLVIFACSSPQVYMEHWTTTFLYIPRLITIPFLCNIIFPKIVRGRCFTMMKRSKALRRLPHYVVLSVWPNCLPIIIWKHGR